MFDIAWSELGVIAVVALVVIGPKDLPKVLRTVGQWTSKARSMAREFQSGIDDMVRESELDELRKSAKQVTDFSLENEIKKTVDPDGSLEKTLTADALPSYNDLVSPDGTLPAPAPTDAVSLAEADAAKAAAQAPAVEPVPAAPATDTAAPANAVSGVPAKEEPKP
ncbi:Sec-independent protein translocase protein TatB [Ferrovibrio sp. MS7]|jgi:sec-independent protein translocase protein TatB|uniref:Sec-independent protein translocase protein TatB n=1 Tax=Ferrovibrio plantarum TaxID=3119164 RepID=UPI001B5ACC06|nr:twin-arginine translocase subunit TatB [Ferrovibrio sp.]